MAFEKRQKQRVAHHLANFDFATLFREELGWDSPPAGTQPLTMELDQQTYTLRPVIHKRDFYFFVCTADDGTIPMSNERNKIETWLSKRNREHLIVFVDGEETRQEWQWVRREIGQPLRRRGERYDKGQDSERLIQKLDALQVALDEEDDITLVDVAGRVRAAFNVDQVTKRFYDNFKKERDRFAQFVEGIEESGILDWYVSIMLNRLMFVYFIQKKGFLDNDTHYLRNRLHQLQAQKGEDQFYFFYRYFLLRLFHEGLGQPERTPELESLLGKIPYLNGGIFQLHEIEESHPDIQIPDAAFEEIINFFDQYDWHLDDRPLRQGNEINPDVLGYIFERYINQKQMGAYYTKEDITEYICQNTIIPYLFDAVQQKVAKNDANLFDPNGPIWSLLVNDPDRYIYEAVRHGSEHELPSEIAVGVEDVSQRTQWNTRTPESHGLPTEIWRETVARRQRYAEVRAKLAHDNPADALVSQINDLITYNLDIKQFAQDVIENCESAELLNAFWQALTTMSVLDPTCGSGAFLFAGLNILQPLYEAAIGRMEALLAEPDFRQRHPNYAKNFQAVLEQIIRHPNRAYYVLKSIMINNLYGVDIMAEATEICKLRLFLKLAAQVDKNDKRPNFGIEPLPDIDFNIRAGNTLVGFATYDEVERAINRKFDFYNMLGQIQEKAEAVERLTRKFRDQQTTHGGEVTVDDKLALRSKLQELEAILNRYLAEEYGVNPDDEQAFDAWLTSHQPFHWFTEFYGIVQERGGFDVIVGNPPYVEYRVIRKTYKLPHNAYKSEPAANLYAYCMERSCLLNDQNEGRFGMIVPAGILGLDAANSLREIMFKGFPNAYCSTFAIRPSKLFDGVDQRLCIFIGSVDTKSHLWTSGYTRWSAGERDSLFTNLFYTKSMIHSVLNRIPQLSRGASYGILEKLKSQSERYISSYYVPKTTGHLFHYHRSPRYWIRAMNFQQYFKSDTRSRSVHHFRDIYFESELIGNCLAAIINSSLFFFWFVSVGNGRNITSSDVEMFPVGTITDDIATNLSKLFSQLMQDYKDNSFIRTRKDAEFQEFRPSRSKPIIDQIDTILAKHYGFTDEELDFIINYDIKYRMGDDLFVDSETQQ